LKKQDQDVYFKNRLKYCKEKVRGLDAIFDWCYSVAGNEVVVLGLEDDFDPELIAEHAGKTGTVVDFDPDGGVWVDFDFSEGKPVKFFKDEVVPTAGMQRIHISLG